jgi:predicted amidohydrolase YtcJ
MNRFTKILVGCLLVLCGKEGTAQAPDLILTGGKIFTADTANLYAEALAIRGDRITAVGTTAAIQQLAGPKTRIIPLHGRTVIPGINDAHDHIGYGAPVSRFMRFTEPMLPGPSLQQVVDSLALAVQQVPKGTVIQGHLGLRLIEDAAARRAILDRVAPDHPVILNAPWGHGTILNTAAMKLLGISDTAPDPVGGFYERLPGTNRLSGLLAEYAEFGVLRQWHNTLPQKVIEEVFRQYSDNALRMGITTVQHMATSLDLEKTVAVVNAVGSPLRIRVIRFPGTTHKGRDLSNWSRQYAATPRLQVSGMKWILDGTPLERGALMRDAYSDKPGWAGRPNMHSDTVQRILQEGLASSEQLLLHIVGDSTPNLVLAVMRKTAPASRWVNKRVRFEHADGLMRDQWEDARALGVVAVVNPSHFMFAEVNRARVGKERASHYQPFRSLVEAGIPVAIGSDGPNNPFLNIMFATMHPTNPNEAVTREQAVIAYTRGSAYAESKEREKGMLKKGMLADLSVLSQDIFSVPPPELPKTESELTIIGGKIVYEATAAKK